MGWVKALLVSFYRSGYLNSGKFSNLISALTSSYAQKRLSLLSLYPEKHCGRLLLPCAALIFASLFFTSLPDGSHVDSEAFEHRQLLNTGYLDRHAHYLARVVAHVRTADFFFFALLIMLVNFQIGRTAGLSFAFKLPILYMFLTGHENPANHC